MTRAAYAPASRRGEIAIYTGGARQRWSPLDVERSGSGPTGVPWKDEGERDG